MTNQESEAICYLSVAELSRRIHNRDISVTEVTQAYLSRINVLDSQICSYITVTDQHARKAAANADALLSEGKPAKDSLFGIPYGLKDMFDTKQILTTAHSRLLSKNVPDRDAFVVGKLNRSGAVLLGKQACHEFAHGGPSFDLPWPPSRNPWNTAHYTGSSSTGSGAAVSAGLCAFALGTDTGGSVRTPAWMCGVVGFKPSFGRIGRSGVIPFSSSCDHVGPLTRDVTDCALVLKEIEGHDPSDPGSSRKTVHDIKAPTLRTLKGIKIGVLRHHWEDEHKANPELKRAVDQAIEVYKVLGADVQDIKVRPLYEYYAIRILLTECEIFSRHQHILQHDPTIYGDHFLGRILAAVLFTSADHLAAQRERRVIINEFADLHKKYDFVLTAGSGPAPRMNAHKNIGAKQKWASPSMGTVFSVTGTPALALPCGFSESGLPLGLQLAGKHNDDQRVLEIGYAYEQATGWHLKRPPIKPDASITPIDDHHAEIKLDIDQTTRDRVAVALQHAGIKLSEKKLDLLLESAPYAIRMAMSINRNRKLHDETAAIFNMDNFLND